MFSIIKLRLFTRRFSCRFSYDQDPVALPDLFCHVLCGCMCVLRAVTQASLVLYTPAGIIRSYMVIDSVALDPFRSKLDIKIEFLESLDCFAMFVEPFWLILAPTGPMVQFQRMSPIEMHKL